MPAKIFIKRQFKRSDTQAVISVLNKIRTSASAQPGYISGETWVSPDDPARMLVVVTWDSLANWLAWKHDSKRKAYEATLALYQIGQTDYEEFTDEPCDRPSLG